MNKEICQCGHPKNIHMLFEKPAFGITHICGVNLCDCEQFRPTPLAPDAASLEAPDDTTGAFDDSIIGSLP